MPEKTTKVAIVGAGSAGMALAHHLTVARVCGELVLADLDQDRAWAEAADLHHSLGHTDSDMRIRDGSYYDCADADVCVLSVAVHFPPNTPWLDRIDKSATMLGRIVPSIMATGFDGVFLVTASPVELMTWLVQQLSGLPAQQVVGAGTAVDTARLRWRLAERLHVPPRDITAFVMGAHGEAPVIPWSQIAVGGRRLEELLREEPERLPDFDREAFGNTIADLVYQLRSIKGAAFYTHAAGTASIVRAILADSGETLPASVILQGEYGWEDVCLSVPAVLGAGGVRRIVEYPLTAAEKAQLDRAARSVEQYMTDIS